MNYNTLLFALLVSIFISSCEGPKGDPGPIGIPSPPPTQARQGFIKGSLNTKVDGMPKDFNFDFEGKNYGDENYYEVINDSITNISIGKIYATNGEPYISGKCLLAFTVKDMKNLQNPKSNAIQLNFRKDLTKAQLLDVNVYSMLLRGSIRTNDSISFTEVKYDSISRIIQGKFYARIFQRDAAGNAIYENKISNGSFNSEIYRQFRNSK